MYFLAEGTTVPNNTKPIRMGYPVPQYMSPNICICTQTTPYIYTPLNASILREALLANPELTKKLLGLVVTPVESSYEVPTAKVEPLAEDPIQEPQEEKPKKKTKGAKS